MDVEKEWEANGWMRAQVRYRLEKAREIEGARERGGGALRRNRGGRPRRALPSHPPPAADGEAGPEVSIGVPALPASSPARSIRPLPRGADFRRAGFPDTLDDYDIVLTQPPG